MNNFFNLFVDNTNDDLEYTNDYQLLQQLVLEKPEQQFGETIIQATPPDWHQVEKITLELSKKTIDLRVIAYLTYAWTAMNGLKGYNDGLELVLHILQNYWQDFYPKLEIEDELDPLPRVNALSSLANTHEFIQNFKNSFVVNVLSTKYSIRDIEAIYNDLYNVESLKIDKSKMTEILQNDLLKPDSNISILQKIWYNLGEITRITIENLGSDWSPDFQLFSKIVEPILTHVVDKNIKNQERLQQDERLEDENQLYTDQIMSQHMQSENYNLNNAKFHMGNMQIDVNLIKISSRVDALTMLEKIREYFQLHEPSHPAPFMLETVMQTVQMNFCDLLKKLSPEGMIQFEKWLIKKED